MRKKMLLLTLALAATAASLAAPKAQAVPFGGGPFHSCQVCTTLDNGAQCCISCRCNADGVPMACAENACIPAP